ncbi:MAG: 4'-phosphopantetheinyl transferase superfamily protein, partial [Bacteroidota bacterium]
MLKTYKANTDFFRKKYTLEELIKTFPPTYQQRANRYRFPVDAYNFAIGRLMIQSGIRQFDADPSWEKITFQKNGKPLHPEIEFNISHSTNQVVGVFSNQGTVGIDIEVLKGIKLKDFHSFFTPKEWETIYGNKKPLEKFYWYWTRKESIIKALGVTLNFLHHIELDATKDFFLHKGKKWYLSDLNFGKN